jgi:hypothetical protein
MVEDPRRPPTSSRHVTAKATPIRVQLLGLMSACKNNMRTERPRLPQREGALEAPAKTTKQSAATVAVPQ